MHEQIGDEKRVLLLHGAGYVGGELIRLLAAHPTLSLAQVTSRSLSGKPVWEAHPSLRGQVSLTFTDPGEADPEGADVVLVAAEHGKGVETVLRLLEGGFEGPIVDLSADFRFEEAGLYDRWFGYTHPAPELLERFQYGMPELFAPYPGGTRHIANPGCFATGITLALWPVARHLPYLQASVTALTGASGSGTRPKETTHFPTREGNVRAYKVLAHQHLPEITQSLGGHAEIAFVPASGPWTRGIWGTAHLQLPETAGAQEVAQWYEAAYGNAPFVRLWPEALPELRYAVGTPYCDIGFIVQERRLIVGFALDNLLKGAASQAVQNLNLLLGLPETAGLLPETGRQAPVVSLQSDVPER